jgi:DNA polymerase III delta subunit
LLLAREIRDEHGKLEDVIRLTGLRKYRAQIAVEHAGRFSLNELEAIYHRLLEIDIAIKTGELAGDLALEMLVVELTN